MFYVFSWDWMSSLNQMTYLDSVFFSLFKSSLSTFFHFFQLIFHFQSSSLIILSYYFFLTAYQISTWKEILSALENGCHQQFLHSGSLKYVGVSKIRSFSSTLYLFNPKILSFQFTRTLFDIIPVFSYKWLINGNFTWIPHGWSYNPYTGSYVPHWSHN